MADLSVHYTRDALDAAERAFIQHMNNGPRWMTREQLHEWTRAALDAALVAAIAEVHGQDVIDAAKYRRLRDKGIVPMIGRYADGRNDL